MIQYQIVYGRTMTELMQYVNTQMKLGWKPQGGVSVAEAGQLHNGYYQAMIKK